jgi:hypothetical protein
MTDETSDIKLPDELTVLKDRARLMGITFSNNIGLEALRKKVQDAQEGISDDADAGSAAGSGETVGSTDNSGAAGTETAEVERMVDPETKLVIPSADPLPGETQTQAINRFRRELRAEQLRLIRVRIQNLNPSKADLPGEIFTVANDFIGNITKFIPYGEATDEGYHIPFCIYNELKNRRFNHIRTGKDKKTGTPKVETSWQKEFALEVLPQLTPTELKQLATAQTAAGSVDGAAANAGGESI